MATAAELAQIFGKVPQISTEDLRLIREFYERQEAILDLVGDWTQLGSNPHFGYLSADWIYSPNLYAGVLLNRENNLAISSPVTVAWENNKRDTHNFSDLAANSDRIVIPGDMEGVYLFNTQGYIASPETTLTAEIYVNQEGSDNLLAAAAFDTFGAWNLTGMRTLSPGDYAYVRITTSSAQINASVVDPTYFGAYLLLNRTAGQT